MGKLRTRSAGSRLCRSTAALLVIVMVAGACGDSGDEGDGDSDSGATTEVTPTADSDDGDTDETLATLGTLADSIPGIDDDCVAVANVFGYLARASFAVTGQADFDIDDVQAEFNQAAAQLPSDLQDDLAVMSDGILSFYRAIQDSGIDLSSNARPDPQQLAALEAALNAIDTDEFQAASEALNSYAEEQCEGLTE